MRLTEEHAGRFLAISPASDPDYRDRIAPISKQVWPEFMLHDPVADQYWEGLFDYFPDYQFALVDQKSGSVAGIANSVPMNWQAALEDLPEEGWDWALIKSDSDRLGGLSPNLLCGLQISIAPGFQRQGLSSALLSRMVQLAETQHLPSVILPVRPSMKHQYPLASIETYITWVREDGLPFDPWLRVHVRNGGRIMKPCPLAMRITGTVAEWEAWTGMSFFESGEHIIPGALVPVSFDLARDIGTYVEPNVWVVHASPASV